jgi:hypothetical protein
MDSFAKELEKHQELYVVCQKVFEDIHGKIVGAYSLRDAAELYNAGLLQHQLFLKLQSMYTGKQNELTNVAVQYNLLDAAILVWKKKIATPFSNGFIEEKIYDGVWSRINVLASFYNSEPDKRLDALIKEIAQKNLNKDSNDAKK